MRPSSSIRYESDPFEAMRVALVIRSRGASIRPASTQPPTSPNASRVTTAQAAFGANARTRSSRPGMNPFAVMAASGGTYRSRNTQTTASSNVPANSRNPA